MCQTPRFAHIFPFLAKKCVNQADLHIFCPSGPKNVRKPGYLHIFSAAAAPGCPSRKQKSPALLTKPPIDPSHEQNRPRSLMKPGGYAPNDGLLHFRDDLLLESHLDEHTDEHGEKGELRKQFRVNIQSKI